MAARARDSKERFSSRVEAYVKYRPGYPAAVYELFRDEMGITPGKSVVADVGAGTGISAEPLLRTGHTVYCVEPNAEMRAASERLLRQYSGFRSVDGSGEHTTLPDRFADLTVCAQAFHWLDHAAAAAEFRRICKSGGYVAVMWNNRRTESNAFLAGYDALLVRHGSDYTKVAHEKTGMTTADFDRIFGGGVTFRRAGFHNEQRFDLQGLRGRVESASYAPAAGERGHAELFAGLDELFARHARDGRVVFEYETEVYFAKVP